MKKCALRDVNYYSCFNDMIENIGKGREDRAAIHWFTRKGEEKGVTYGTLVSDVRNLQASFLHRGFAKKHIAVLGENCYEWLLVYLAAACCGSVVVCVDIEQPEETIQQMVDMTDVEVLFYSASLKKIGQSFRTSAREVFSLADGEDASIKTLLEEGAALRKENPAPLQFESDPSATASIVFTSGTTSYSKPVMLSQRAILTNASDALASVEIGDTVFTSLPFYHTYGITCAVIGELIGGVKIYINGNLKTMMRDLLRARPHTLLTVPLVLEAFHGNLWKAAEENKKADQLRFLLKCGQLKYLLGMKNFGKKLEEIRERCFGSVRLVICGAAHLNPEITANFTHMGVTILQGYGITECSPLVSVNRIRANHFDSVGLVMPNCEVKIEQEEILVRGANVMTGYYKQPELTEQAFTDGWFSTGDLGYLDKDGFLHITGRKKNLIVFQNGKKLSPEKIEEKIRKIPLVQDVLVYGAVSGAFSDDVQVAVSVYPNKEKTKEMPDYEILDVLQKSIDEINKELPFYQQIQMVNIRKQEFSKTALQKIKRHMT